MATPVYNALGKVGWQTEIAYGGSDITSPDSHLIGPYVHIQQLTSITPGEAETDEVEMTHLKSPKRRREFEPGFTDGGTAECEGTVRYEANVIVASQKFVLNEHRGGTQTKRWWRLSIYDNVNLTPTLLQTVYFVGYVDAANIGPFSTEDPQGFTFSIRTSGDEVWVPALA